MDYLHSTVVCLPLESAFVSCPFLSLGLVKRLNKNYSFSWNLFCDCCVLVLFNRHLWSLVETGRLELYHTAVCDKFWEAKKKRRRKKKHHVHTSHSKKQWLVKSGIVQDHSSTALLIKLRSCTSVDLRSPNINPQENYIVFSQPVGSC